MLATRLWMGAVLIVMAGGVLIIDERLAPWYPFLFFLVMAAASAACYELVMLLPAQSRPSLSATLIGVLAVLLANWPAHVLYGDRVEQVPFIWVISILAVV